MWLQTQISDESFAVLEQNYNKFIEVMDDPYQEPITVYKPLNPKQLEELELIREVSRDLQAKKEEDLRQKAAQDKEDEKITAEKEKEKKEEQNVEEEAVEEDIKKEE